MLLGSNPMKAHALDAPEHAPPPHSLATTALEAAMASSVVFYES